MVTVNKAIYSEELQRVLDRGRRKIVALQRIHWHQQTDSYKYRQRFEIDKHKQNDVNNSHTIGNEYPGDMEDSRRKHDGRVSG
jgi:hypothetical protein